MFQTKTAILSGVARIFSGGDEGFSQWKLEKLVENLVIFLNLYKNL